jgi:flagellar motor switch protein FliN
MSSSDLNLPDLAQGGVPALANSPDAPMDDMREKLASDLKPVFDVPVSVQAVIGRTTIEVAKLLELGPGSVLELDRRVGEAIDIYVTRVLSPGGKSSSSTTVSA